jgi:hypothetical protein
MKWWLAVLVACGGGPKEGKQAPAGPLELAFEPVSYETSLGFVTDLAFTPDGSGEALVVDLYGGVEHVAVTSGGAEVLSHFVVDDVFAEYDAGLLGVAVDPDFSTNRFVFLAYTTGKTRMVVRRLTLQEDAAATLASAVTILQIDTPGSPRWHNIAAMGFEPSGVMWLLVGDKGLFEPAQDPNDLLGKVVRIVPSRTEGESGYTSPDDGLSYDPSSPPEVYAAGIRSPWTALLHAGTFYIGDVGLDDVEEINVVSAPGDNFGWPEVEGACAVDVLNKQPDCSRYVDPWMQYGRTNSHPFVLDDLEATPTNKRSVYVGWIFQPGTPDPYEGRWEDVLLFGDAYLGFVRAVPVSDDGTGSWHVGHLQFPTAWGQAPDGHVYVATLGQEPAEDGVEGASVQASVLYRAVLR